MQACPPRLQEFRDHAQASLESPRGRRWFQEARCRRPALDAFATLEDLVAFLRHAEAPFTGRDELLRALLAEHRGGSDPARSHDLFLIIYYPLLTRLAREFGPATKGGSLDEEDTAAEILNAFFHLLATLDPATNRDINTSLAKGTRRDFLRWAGPEFKHANETCAPPGPGEEDDDGDVLDGDSAAIALTLFSHQDLVAGRARPPAAAAGRDLDAAELALGELRRRGVISDTAHFLLVGTIVYGRHLKQVVAGPVPTRKPLSYEAAKKRVQHAQVAIHRYLEAAQLELSDLLRAGADLFSSRDVPADESAGSTGVGADDGPPGEEPQR